MRFNAVVYLTIFAGVSLAAGALAQQPPSPPPDPRLAQQTIAAQQAVLVLREAEIRAMQADAATDRAAYEARLETAMEWLKTAQEKQSARSKVN